MISDKDKYVSMDAVKGILHQAKSLDRAWDVIFLPYVEMPKWIPVNERLPDTYTAVLVSDGKYVWVDSLEDDFDENGSYVVWWDSSNSVDFDKTAWMPLPEPYEEK